MIGEMIRGALAGVTYSLTAWGKKKDQRFEWVKFGTTVFVGACAGVMMNYLNLPIEASYEFVIALGVVPVVENVFKWVYRRLS
jgi:hypothetical protein